ncbi:MAG TPA: hypothetical protein DCY13_24745 [Verrucomicrobiales bacterium]|jgi:hypothetical protein|nr:hypothetical protein [Verrucomicrobiales bacterium]
MPKRAKRSSSSKRPRLDLPLSLQAQPTDTSCGPTCLQAVYAFHGDEVPIRQLIEEVPTVEGGGTVGVLLGLHALKRGYDAKLYTYNLRIFDPSWFHPRRLDVAEKLREQLRHRSGKRRDVIQACLEFVEHGGTVHFEDLTAALIRRHLLRNEPILTGLSATFLYRASREMPDTGEDDDLRGEPLGHFVVLKGYSKRRHRVLVADPYEANPLSPKREYQVPMDRLINAILLGVLTYDANLLIIRPR